MRQMRWGITVLLLGMMPLGAVELSAPPGSVSGTQSSWTLHGRSESVGVYRNIDGAGATTYEDGMTYRQELGLRSEGELGSGRAGVSIDGRATDDERIASETVEMTALRAFYETQRWDIVLGDVAQTFSPLVFNGALRGSSASYTSRYGETRYLRYSVIGGVASESWNDLFETRMAQTDAVAGEMRYQHATARSVSLALSAAKSREGSDDAAVDTNSSDAMTAGVSWDWRFNRYIKSRGDMAWSSTKVEHEARQTRYAGRIDILTRPTRSLSSNFGYERYETGYDPIVDAVTQDRERFENVTLWNASNQLRGRFSFKMSRDNLDGSLGSDRYIYDWVLALDYRPETLRRGDIGLRLQRKRIEGRGDETSQLNAGVDFRNRLENGWDYGATYDYTTIENEDNATAENTLHTVRSRLGWKTKYDEDNNFRAGIRLDYSVYDIVLEDQKRYGGTLDAGWDHGRDFMLDLLLTSTNTDRDLSVDTSYELYQLIGQYRPFGDGSHILKLNLQRRDSDGGSDAASVIEDEARLSYAFRF